MQKKSPSMISNAFSSTNSDGVRSLIDFGEPGKADPGDSKNPGALANIFARVGGTNLE